jgi:CcmD family protein
MDLSGANVGIVVVNVIIWTGIFVWLLRLGARLRMMEKMEKEP